MGSETQPRAGRAALVAARRGWSVLPLHGVGPDGCTCLREGCPSPGKHPRVPWEPWQRRRPPETTVRRWWRRWPDANLGVVTGAVSGVIVVDVDPRNGGWDSLAQLEAGYGPLPVTVECRTGGGGRHLYFVHPDRPVASRPIGSGLDLKADGGLVVAPPSRHASGAEYRWLANQGPDDMAPTFAPAWLLAVSPGVWARGAIRPEIHRTAAERAEFADLWATLGVDLAPGDQSYLCPFHDDHHPSLHVDAEGCRWLCFGCRRGGGLGRLRTLVPGVERAAPSCAMAAVPASVPVTLAGGAAVDVVGESHYQDALLALTGGRRRYGGVSVDVVAHVVPEPGNPSDPAASAVLIGGRKVGYLRRADSVRLRGAVASAIATSGEATCVATIRGGWERPGDVGLFGVRLWIGGGVTRPGTEVRTRPESEDQAWS